MEYDKFVFHTKLLSHSDYVTSCGETTVWWTCAHLIFFYVTIPKALFESYTITDSCCTGEHNSQHRKNTEKLTAENIITAKPPNASTTQALEEVKAVICRLHKWQQEVLPLTSQWFLLIHHNISLPEPSGTGSRTVCCRLVPPAAATLCQAVLAEDIFGSHLVLILP